METLTLYTTAEEFSTLSARLDPDSHQLSCTKKTKVKVFQQPAGAALLIDQARPLLYRIPRGENGIDEIDTEKLVVQRLVTRHDDRLTCAALAYGQGQTPAVDQRLFCGSAKGCVFTFPLSGASRKTSIPTPYVLSDADGNPVTDLAVRSDGALAYALVDRGGTGRRALVIQDIKGSRGYYSERPAWDVTDSPRWVTVTDDDRFVIVASDRNDTLTVIDTETNRAVPVTLGLKKDEVMAAPCPLPGSRRIVFPLQDMEQRKALVNAVSGFAVIDSGKPDAPPRVHTFGSRRWRLCAAELDAKGAYRLVTADPGEAVVIYRIDDDGLEEGNNSVNVEVYSSRAETLWGDFFQYMFKYDYYSQLPGALK